MPIRSWLLLGAVHLAITAVVPVAVRALLESALRRAHLRSMTIEDVPDLLADPAAAALLAVSGLLMWAATVGWIALTLAVADRHLAGEGASVAAVVRGAARMSCRAVRSARMWLVGVVSAVCGPLAGVHVLAPASAGVTVPPFIPREFSKVVTTEVLWALVLGALLVVAGWAVAATPALLLGRSSSWPQGAARPVRAVGRLASAGCIAVGVGAALLPQLAALALRTGPSGAPADPGALPGTALVAWALYRLVTVVSAQTIAIVVVARARVAAGLPPAAVHVVPSTGSPGSQRRAAIALVVATLLAVEAGTGSAATAEAGAHPRPLVIAHRGYDVGGPENTIAGLEAAAAFDPDYVEVDVQQAADGGFVASHDVNLTLLAGVNRNVFEMTTAELTRTTVRMHGRSDTIPTMVDYVQRARRLQVPLLIELKTTGRRTADPVGAMLAELDSVGGTAGNIFHSLDPGAVQELQRRRPELTVGMTVGINVGSLPEVDADFFVVEQASITPETIEEAHDRGRPLYAWTVNDRATMRALLREGVDGVVTDRLPDALALLRGAGAAAAGARP